MQPSTSSSPGDVKAKPILILDEIRRRNGEADHWGRPVKVYEVQLRDGRSQGRYHVYISRDAKCPLVYGSLRLARRYRHRPLLLQALYTLVSRWDRIERFALPCQIPNGISR